MKDIADSARSWLFTTALPLWSTAGVDRLHGGFFDAIGLDGASLAVPKRCRSVARQIYSFAEIVRLGAPRSSLELVSSGCDYLLAKFAKGDGAFRYSVGVEGGCEDDTCSNYELAFVMLALAHASRALRWAELENSALTVCDYLHRERKHPVLGYCEGAGKMEPLLANPHMHLFEAALAWRETSGKAVWIEMSDAIGGLCLTRMIDGETGTLCEHYDMDWNPLPQGGSCVVEPGHQYEWAWLLMRWADCSSAEVASAAERLCHFGSTHGIDRKRAVAMGTVSPDGTVRDGSARLWAQAEWLKAILTLAKRAPAARRGSYEDEARKAWNALYRFLETPYAGTWYDVLTEDDTFKPEPARATSFYHIVGAIAALVDYAG